MEQSTITKRLSDEFVQGFPNDLEQNHDIWYRIEPDENGNLIFTDLEENECLKL